MMGCKKCQGICGISVLVAGIIFLLQDLGYASWWALNWWTVLFLLVGIGSLGMRSCPDCQAMMTGKMKK